MNPNNKEIKVAKNYRPKTRQLILKKFRPYTELDVSKPISCHVALDPSTDKKLPAILYFSNNEMAHLELEKPLNRPLEKGMHLVFYNNNKVLGHAQIEDTNKDAPPITDTFNL